jgi:hypothetical protein
MSLQEEIHQSRNYAHLPEELLGKILEKVPATVQKMNELFDIQDKPIQDGIRLLRENDMIRQNDADIFSTSLIAVDGGVILEKMTGTDILLAVAVGVEGLTEDYSASWRENKNQFHQWQTVLAHDEANARLAQGVMFLMELSVLANAEHEIRIMDGTHFTPLLKINSLLSAKEESAGPQYTQALKDFLNETYEKIIPDIPDIIEAALRSNAIIAIAKYSSSRDIIDAYLASRGITIDDKTFFSLGLNEDEFLSPLPVGQSEQERTKVWNDLHVRCNLMIPEEKELNKRLENVIKTIRTKEHISGDKKSELYFTYYKPYQDGPAYRIEIKKPLAEDITRLKQVLFSIKKQIVFPEIREPFPQYLVDLMAKNVAGGLFAIQEAIRLSPELKLDKGKFNLLFNYRT